MLEDEEQKRFLPRLCFKQYTFLLKTRGYYHHLDR